MTPCTEGIQELANNASVLEVPLRFLLFLLSLEDSFSQSYVLALEYAMPNMRTLRISQSQRVLLQMVMLEQIECETALLQTTNIQRLTYRTKPSAWIHVCLGPFAVQCGCTGLAKHRRSSGSQVQHCESSQYFPVVVWINSCGDKF